MGATLNETTSQKPAKKLVGFALLSKEKMREIAAQGGRVAHATGRAHQFTPAEGRAAAQKKLRIKRDKSVT